MYDRDNDGTHVRFDTWGDLIAYVEPRTVHPVWRGSSASSSTFDERTGTKAEWSGTRTFDEALKLATQGWSEGEARIKELSERMSARLLQGIVREDWRYDVEGSTFDVARYVEGEPEHWIAPDETYERGVKTVRVIVNVSASAGIPAERLTQRGVAAAALVEALSYAGIKVELWVARSTEGDAHTHDVRVMLKAADQPIEPSRLAFALAHPSMLRRILFAVHLRAARSQFGLGTPVEAKDWQTGAWLKDDEGTIYLKSAHLKDPTFATEASTERWILDTLATHGVNVRGLNAD